MSQTKNSFDENLTFLRKIIKENLWFGSKEEAFEFLEAIGNDKDNIVNELNEKINYLEEQLKYSPEENDILNDLVSFNYGRGEFQYLETDLNLHFKEKLEEFLENYKQNQS